VIICRQTGHDRRWSSHNRINRTRPLSESSIANLNRHASTIKRDKTKTNFTANYMPLDARLTATRVAP